ncbi:MAG: D-TA family PLP-dependent enzyme [Bacteroidota bacterium]
MSAHNPWYYLEDPNAIDSPALLVNPDQVRHNIDHAIQIAGDVARLRPHIKTHKSPQVIQMHLNRGIRKFKCATIAEAEMLAKAGADQVLLAYQPVGPRLERLLALIAHYPAVRFAALVDDMNVLQAAGSTAQARNLTLSLWLDLDVGMGRTGIKPGAAAMDLWRALTDHPHLESGGWHAYDGHFRQPDFEARRVASDAAFKAVEEMLASLPADLPRPIIVAGGSPTFPVHVRRTQVELSPGTYPYWDAGYGEGLPDLPFEPAAVLLTRVLSKPGENRLCLDLGHKAVAPEKPLAQRVRLPQLHITAWLGQSEEHLVLEVANASEFQVGDVIYGIPGHICPTVALHQELIPVRNHAVAGEAWPVVARVRRLEAGL